MPSNSILNIKKDGEWVEIPCLKGEDGFSPTATVEKVGKVATITITDINGTTTATIADGTGSGGSGEENTIESISVNGTPISIDENKNVDITVPSIDGLAKTEDIPTNVSELTNDSGYLTEHQDISGKVDKVEGKSLISDAEITRLATVDNYDDTDIRTELAKKADITSIPSKVSDLENDNKYQTESEVNSIVTTEIAKIVADAPEDLNTLKEMSDWIAGHEDDASAMNSAIQANKSDIATLQTDKVDKETGKSLLADTDKTNYDDAVSKAHTHDNKSVLDEITSDKISSWDNKSDFSGSYNDLSDKPTIPKADGTTITADEDGTLHGATTVECDTELSDTSENPVQNKVIKAQIDSLNQAIEEAKALKASLEQYGMVQLNDTSVVTDSTGLALPATEKNPNLEGTLANQISQLNTDSKKSVNRYRFTIGTNESLKIPFKLENVNNESAYLLSLSCQKGNQYATYLIEGYGETGSRLRVSLLSNCDSSSLNYIVSINGDATGGITITNNNVLDCFGALVCLFENYNTGMF